MSNKANSDNPKVFSHRVVEVTMNGSQRVETPVSKAWLQPKAAQKELNRLKQERPSRWYSIQKR